MNKPAFEDTLPIDSPAGGKPPFEETMPVDPGSGYWSDVKKNAVEGVKEWPQAATNLLRAGTMFSPVKYIASGVQALQGTPWDQTTTGKDAAIAGNMIRNMPKSIFQTVTDIGKGAAMPVQMATGTAPQDTMFGKAFRERPLSATANVAAAAIPIAKRLFSGTPPAEGAANVPGSGETPAPTDATAASSEATLPNYLETKGAQGLNSIAGIRGATIDRMTNSGENPGTIGVDLAKKMTEEGSIGKTATETFQKASKMADQYGQKVSQSLDAIRKANEGLGVYPELEDSLKVDSTPLLKPILDKANELRDSGYPLDRSEARGWRAMYNSLSKKAEAGDQFLTLDDIQEELGKVGDMYKAAGPNHIGMVDKLYGHLANLRDEMINDIANRAGDPKLASDLLDANAGYSRYMRILPDIRKAAGAESVGQMNLGNIFKDIKGAILSGPSVSRLMMKAGSSIKKSMTLDEARAILKEAGGNKTVARQLASQKYGFDSKKQ